MVKKTIKKKTPAKKSVKKAIKKKPVRKTVSASVIEIDIAPPKPNPNLIGSWAFVLGFIVAIVSGIASMFSFANNDLLIFVLIICGVLVGFLNIKDHEAKEFMIAGAILVIMSWLGLSTIAKIDIYANILFALETLFIPATIIVALKSLFMLGHK